MTAPDLFPPAESLLDGKVMLHAGDCLAVLPTLPDNSLDACVCDPPYHLTSIVQRFGGEGAAPAQHGSDGAFARASRGFMGKEWDGGDIAFRPDVWREVLRVLKPGGHLLAFAATRGFGRMQVAIEDAGFETRDCILELLDLDPVIAAFVNSLNDAQRAAFLRIVTDTSPIGGLMAWMFGTGFPKSHNVALDFEKTLCNEVKEGNRTVWRYRDDGAVMQRVAPFRDPRAQEWAGFGTAIKPAFEPIVMARKPLAGSVAETVAAFGCGALNIDAGRIGTTETITATRNVALGSSGSGVYGGADQPGVYQQHSNGRWPANVIHDGSDAVLAAFPAQTGNGFRASASASDDRESMFGLTGARGSRGHNDSGSASRFFWSGKADADDRLGSKHPTVKPVDLMAYLVGLVTAPGQTVLDIFAGTGTTGEAAWRVGRRAVLIEREEEYRDDIRRRMALALAGPDERKRESIKAKGDEKPFEAGSLFAGLEG